MKYISSISSNESAYKFLDSTKKNTIYYENAEYICEAENKKKDSKYEEIGQTKVNTEQDKVYTELN